MFKLTNEQKLQNLEERKTLLNQKISNIQKEIEGIDGKIRRLQTVETKVTKEGNQSVLPTIVQNLPEAEKQQWIREHSQQLI